MRRIRRTTALIIATAAVAAPAAAEAKSAPKLVTSGITKPLTPEKAKRLQERLERTGRYPLGPRLSSNRGLERVKQQPVGKPAPAHDAEQIHLTDRPPAPGARLFGYQGTYAERKWPLIQWVNYVYATAIPNMGGAFRTPSVYEVPHGGYTPTGCGQIWNAGYCATLNSIGFSSYYGNWAFTNIGDAAFAALMAHEYGHGAQQWLRVWGGRMNKKFYVEGFADCMAGGWLAQMYNWRYVDGVGRGDWREYIDVLSNLSANVTAVSEHDYGPPAYRHAHAVYGWNYGMRGCLAWGRQMASLA
jgi:hypothetical protein